VVSSRETFAVEAFDRLANFAAERLVVRGDEQPNATVIAESRKLPLRSLA